MKHLGDITKINGAEIEPVWAIIGGSPCQDLSVAGKRAGLAGARSGLFMEQIRVIKEMRQHERDIGRANELIRPRYMVWENVPGAFSSNKGEDFRAVLEETARIADGNADVPQPPNGKWSNAGCIMGNGWSIAWRVHDAQFWGVPQRRRRISLVADFGGQSAPEILFERKGVSGDIAESGTAGQGTAADAERSTDTTIGVKCLNPSFPQSARVYDADGVWHSLNANENGGQSRDAVLYEPKSAFEENWAKSDVKNALRAEASKSSHAICIQGNCIDRADTTECITPWDCQSKRIFNTEGKCPTLQGGVGGGVNNPAIFPAIDRTYAIRMREGCAGGGKGPLIQEEKSGTLGTSNDQTICYGICSYASNSMKSDNPHSEIYKANTARTLDLNGGNPACNQGGVMVLDARGNGDGATAPTLTGDHNNRVTDYTATFSFGRSDEMQESNVASTQSARQYKCATDLVAAVDCRNGTENPDVAAYTSNQFANYTEGVGTLRANGGDLGGGSESLVASRSVRRLTPLECERLQGYPGGWADIPGQKNVSDDEVAWWIEVFYDYDRAISKKPERVKRKGEKAIRKWLKNPASDSARYKALGNSIALPFWRWMLQRMSTYLPADATLGSLFDGIGGFPLIWEEMHGKGTARWASEIEPFPIRVTEYHFGRAYE